MPVNRPSWNRATLSQLVEATGMDKEPIRRRLNAHPAIEPLLRTGTAVYYDTPTALTRIFLGEGALNPALERARKDRADAELKELSLRERRGELIECADADRGELALATIVSGRVMAIPSKIAMEIAAESDPAVCHEILHRECEEAMRDLADAGRLAAERLADLVERQEAARGQD